MQLGNLKNFLVVTSVTLHERDLGKNAVHILTEHNRTNISSLYWKLNINDVTLIVALY